MPKPPASSATEANIQSDRAAKRCEACSERNRLPFDISMAFQPIIDLDRGLVFAHEALVRGPNGEGAGWVLSQVDEKTRYTFDQTCRVTAIEEAARLGVHRDGALVSINFLPNAVYEPANCIRATLRAAERACFPLSSIMFEVTEAEEVRDTDHLSRIIASYKEMGFTVAIDDFGAGFAGLSLLSDFRPDLVKLDMKLVRGIHLDAGRRAICRGVVGICTDLGIRVIAEGIETDGELSALRDLGISLVQGYLFAKPQLGALYRLGLPGPR